MDIIPSYFSRLYHAKIQNRLNNSHQAENYWGKHVPLTARFQLVENALNDLHQVTFCNITAFSTDKYGKISDFIVSLSGTSYMRGVFILVFTVQR